MNGFKLFLLQRGLKASSISNYIDTLNTVLNAVGEPTPDSIHEHFITCFSKGNKATYVNKIVDVLRVYGQYINDEFLKKLKPFKEDYFEKATMTDEEITAFLNLEAPKVTHPHNHSGKMVTRYVNKKGWDKMTMFWKICAYSGCRMGEASHLKQSDIDFSQKSLTFRSTKTNDDRTIPIPSNIYSGLMDYCRSLEGDVLFPSVQGGGDGYLDNVAWGHSFHSRIKKLGIKRKHLSPYSLRHSFISTLVGEDLTGTMAIVGHKDIRTTQRYYHKNLKTMRKAIQKHPVIKQQIDPLEKVRALIEAIKTFEFDKDGRFTYSLKEENKRLMLELNLTDE